MSRWFMLEEGKHHTIDESLYLHYRKTCNVHDIEEVSSARFLFGERATAMQEIRLAPSRVGWVAIYYETKGVITFFAQINEKRAAWQRIQWAANFDRNWDDGLVREAIENFLWVAQCEESRSLLPQS